MNPYTIQSGDTLSAIAQKNNTTVGNLINLNPTIKDPNKIYAGSSLNLGLNSGGAGNTTTNVITPPTTTPTPPAATKPYIADSSPVVAQEEKVKKQLESLGYGANDTYAQMLKETQTKSDSMIQNQIDTNAALLTEREKTINTQFNEAIANAKDEQDKELASNVVGLARIGGYLGGTASATGALNSLRTKHQAEVTKLENDRQSALAIAREAINDKQYKLALDKLNSAKEFAKIIEDRNQQMFDSYLKLSEENRQQSKFVLDEGERVINQYVEANKMPSVDQMQTIAQSLGTTPDIVQGLFEAKRKSYELEQRKAQTDLDVKLLSVLKDIPKGQYVNIAGQMYGGLKASDGSGVTPSMQIDEARKFVNDNRTKMNYAQLNVQLRKNFSKLQDGDVSMILNEYNVPKSETYLSPEALDNIAKNTVKNSGDAQTATSYIKNYPTLKSVDASGKETNIDLSPSQVEQVVSAINTKYSTPEKSWFDKMMGR